MAAFMLRVKLIRIVTPSLAHALKVFETINERGVGLNAMDLLKNLLFMSTPSSEFAKLKQRWKNLVDTLDSSREKPLRFLRYYILSHYKLDESSRPVREDEIYEWFVGHKLECGIETQPLAFVEQLVTCAGAWRNFVRGLGIDGAPNRYLMNISWLSGAARQHYILLLAGRNLPAPLFAELARHIENLFFCYVITRESTKTFERNFARWSSELRAAQTEEDLESFIRRYFLPDMQTRLNAFRFAMSELTEARIQQYRLRYILAKLTQYVEEQAWRNPSDGDLSKFVHGSVNIEHILPQTPMFEVANCFDRPDEYNDYKYKLGNLTLLEKTINTSVSNSSYDQKCAGYGQSSFLLTKSLVEKPHVGVDTSLNRAVKDLIQFDTWTSDSIDRRQQMLANLAEAVWMKDVSPAQEQDGDV